MAKGKKTSGIAKKCFVLSPIGAIDSPVRLRADNVLNYIIRPVVGEFGYTAVRADEISEPGIITHKVIDRVMDSELVVADLSGLNPNVFYELAVRHAVGLPIIQLIDARDKLPFDVAGMRTIMFDVNDIASVEHCKDEIRDQIAYIEDGTQRMETPISNAIVLKNLRASGTPWERSVAGIMERLESLAHEVRAQRRAAAVSYDPTLDRSPFVSQFRPELVSISAEYGDSDPSALGRRLLRALHQIQDMSQADTLVPSDRGRLKEIGRLLRLLAKAAIRSDEARVLGFKEEAADSEDSTDETT